MLVLRPLITKNQIKMTKSLRFLFAFVAVVTLLSSCKKTAVTDLSILTSHKWNITNAVETYSDSGSISHNLIPTSAICQTTGYSEFHDFESSAATSRLAYYYSTSNCTGYSSPSISTSPWDIDPDNANINTSIPPGTSSNTQWYKITTINSSTLVLTFVYQRTLSVYNPITFTYSTTNDVATDTITFTAM